MNDLIPTSAFHWILILGTGLVSVWWVFHDIGLLARLRQADRRDPLVRDQQFGYSLGICMAIIGIVGTLLFMHHTGVI